MYCPGCGTQSINSANYCTHCGKRLSSDNNSLGHSPEHSSPEKAIETHVEGSSVVLLNDADLYQAFIGKKNELYYLHHFSGLQKTDKYESFNWAACLVTVPWMMYRKMWVLALIYTISVYGLIVCAGKFFLIHFNYDNPAGRGVWLVLYLLCAYWLPGTVGNSFYFLTAENTIKRIKRVYAGITSQRFKMVEAAERAGGTSWLGMLLGSLLLLLSLGFLNIFINK